MMYLNMVTNESRYMSHLQKLVAGPEWVSLSECTSSEEVAL